MPDRVSPENTKSGAQEQRLSVITTTDPCSAQLPRFVVTLGDLSLPAPWTVELVVVDDLKHWHSAKEGEAALHSLSARPARTRIIWYPERRGQIAAVRKGIQASTGTTVLTIDPDMHHCLPDIRAMLACREQGHELIHGHRTLRNDTGPVRRLGSAAANFMVRTAAGFPARDYGSPVMMAARSLLEEIEPYFRPHTDYRLYLYALHKEKLQEYPLRAPDTKGRGRSQYSLLSLIATFFNLMQTAAQTRRLLHHSNSPQDRI